MPKEINHSRKDQINIQNTDDSEYLKLCSVKYLNPADKNRPRNRKIEKHFVRELYFKDIKFPVKFRDVHKIEKTNYMSIIVFGYKNKEKFSIYFSKYTFKR